MDIQKIKFAGEKEETVLAFVTTTKDQLFIVEVSSEMKGELNIILFMCLNDKKKGFQYALMTVYEFICESLSIRY